MSADLVARARERVDRVKSHVSAAREDVIAIWRDRDWIPLGYASFDELCDAEFEGARISLPVDDRREVVGEMRSAGMSTRAIGSALGVSHPTVINDMRSTGQGLPVDQPERITSLDGRERPATQPPRPEPEPEPRPVETVHLPEPAATPPAPRREPRSPLPEAFSTAISDLIRIVDRVQRLAADDRFPRNAEQVAAKHRSDLTRAHDALTGVIDQLPTHLERTP